MEFDIARHLDSGPLGDFRLFLITATAASIIGASLISTFQRYFSCAFEHFQAIRSLPRLLLRIFSHGGINYMRGRRAGFVAPKTFSASRRCRRIRDGDSSQRFRDGHLDCRRIRVALCGIPEARLAHDIC